MGQFIEFLPRQALVGSSGSSAVICTNVVDVSDFDKIDIQFQAFTYSGSGAAFSGSLEHTDNPCMSGFSGATGTVTVSTTGESAVVTVSGVKRFVRGKITIPQDHAAMITFRGRAYDC